MISVDELRAAGALDVPAGWRKSLGVEPQRDLFSDLVDEDDTRAETAEATPGEGDGKGSAEEEDGRGGA
jgi:hypothetical protein